MRLHLTPACGGRTRPESCSHKDSRAGCPSRNRAGTGMLLIDALFLPQGALGAATLVFVCVAAVMLTWGHCLIEGRACGQCIAGVASTLRQDLLTFVPARHWLHLGDAN